MTNPRELGDVVYGEWYTDQVDAEDSEVKSNYRRINTERDYVNDLLDRTELVGWDWCDKVCKLDVFILEHVATDRRVNEAFHLLDTTTLAKCDLPDGLSKMIVFNTAAKEDGTYHHNSTRIKNIAAGRAHWELLVRHGFQRIF